MYFNASGMSIDYVYSVVSEDIKSDSISRDEPNVP